MASTSKNIQPIAHQSNVDTRKPTLNYEATKKRYFERVQKNPKLLKAPLCTKKGIEEKIRQISMDVRGASDLMVKNVDGKKKLFMKKNDWNLIEVISVEEAFDIVLEKHVACNHSNAATTYEKLTGLYSVPIFCVCWLVSSCNVCSASAKVDTQMPATKPVETVPKNPSRGLWRLNIIRDDLLIRNDGSKVSYLLIFKEDSTNFVLIKPLFESSEELALQLSKIFTEFGFPDKVYVPPNMLRFYMNIFHRAHLINGLVTVPLEKAPNFDIFMEDKIEVLNEIKNWMDITHDAYWEQGCHIVQYKLNTTKKRLNRMFNKEEIYGVPFNLFFEYRFRTKMNWIEPPIYKIMRQPSPTYTITLK